MVFWKRQPQPTAYTINSLQEGPQRQEVQDFFYSLLRTPDGSDFISDIGVLDDGFHKFIFVRANKTGPVVAYALLRQDGEDAEVEQLFSVQRGKGYGHMALQLAEAVAKQHGAVSIWLDSVPEAAAFYIHEGYGTADGVRFEKAM